MEYALLLFSLSKSNQKKQKRVFLSDKEFRKRKGPLIEEINSQKGEKRGTPNSFPLRPPVFYQSLRPLLRLRCCASGWPQLRMPGQLLDW
jgi:hypothetical protein